MGWAAGSYLFNNFNLTVTGNDFLFYFYRKSKPKPVFLILKENKLRIFCIHVEIVLWILVIASCFSQ